MLGARVGDVEVGDDVAVGGSVRPDGDAAALRPPLLQLQAVDEPAHGRRGVALGHAAEGDEGACKSGGKREVKTSAAEIIRD